MCHGFSASEHGLAELPVAVGVAACCFAQYMATFVDTSAWVHSLQVIRMNCEAPQMKFGSLLKKFTLLFWQ
jgi:hypothetical protein